MRWGATRFNLFHTEFGVLSGPGADDGEERARALHTSSAIRAGQSLNGNRMGPRSSPVRQGRSG